MLYVTVTGTDERLENLEPKMLGWRTRTWLWYSHVAIRSHISSSGEVLCRM